MQNAGNQPNWVAVPTVSSQIDVAQAPNGTSDMQSRAHRAYHQPYNAATPYQSDASSVQFVPLNDQPEAADSPYQNDEEINISVERLPTKEAIFYDFRGARTTFEDDPIGYVKDHPKTVLASLVALVMASALVLGISLGTILPNQAAVRARFGNWNPNSAPDLPPVVEKPLPFWDASDPQNKIIGVSLGNWLTLERWMDEDWFTGWAPNAQDEWTFINDLGKEKAAEVLNDHWSSWVVESDLDLMQAHGVNALRIPLGFWTFIPTQGDEPYINTTQLVHLNNMLGWLYKRGMRALLDLHGMPGSQSGDQTTGHAGPSNWFNQTNQDRSITLIKNLITWVSESSYQSVILGVSPVNEPIGVQHSTEEKRNQVRNFYEEVYPLLKAANLPMYFHHAFVPNPTQWWRSFATGKDPRYLVLNDNPYPGYFPAQYNQDLITSRVCQNMGNYTTFPVPSAKTEWSIASGLDDMGWNREFFATQASAYAWGAGWFFWGWRTENSTVYAGRQAGSNYNQMQYSFQWVAQMGIAPSAHTNGSRAYIEALPSPACGPVRDLHYSGGGSASGAPAVSTEAS